MVFLWFSTIKPCFPYGFYGDISIDTRYATSGIGRRDVRVHEIRVVDGGVPGDGRSITGCLCTHRIYIYIFEITYIYIYIFIIRPEKMPKSISSKVIHDHLCIYIYTYIVNLYQIYHIYLSCISFHH